MSKWPPPDIPSQAGKCAFITGANSGIGFHAALALGVRGLRRNSRMPRCEEGRGGAAEDQTGKAPYRRGDRGCPRSCVAGIGSFVRRRHCWRRVSSSTCSSIMRE